MASLLLLIVMVTGQYHFSASCQRRQVNVIASICLDSSYIFECLPFSLPISALSSPRDTSRAPPGKKGGSELRKQDLWRQKQQSNGASGCSDSSGMFQETGNVHSPGMRELQRPTSTRSKAKKRCFCSARARRFCLLRTGWTGSCSIIKRCGGKQQQRREQRR